MPAAGKRLHHMATHHQSALSYLSFGQLWVVISATENWLGYVRPIPPAQRTY